MYLSLHCADHQTSGVSKNIFRKLSTDIFGPWHWCESSLRVFRRDMPRHLCFGYYRTHTKLQSLSSSPPKSQIPGHTTVITTLNWFQLLTGHVFVDSLWLAAGCPVYLSTNIYKIYTPFHYGFCLIFCCCCKHGLWKWLTTTGDNQFVNWLAKCK